MKHTKRLLALLLALALAFALAMPALAAAEVQAQPPGLLNSIMQKLFGPGPFFGIGGMTFPRFVSSYFDALDRLYELFPGNLLDSLGAGAALQSVIYAVLMSIPVILTVTFWFIPTIFINVPGLGRLFRAR